MGTFFCRNCRFKYSPKSERLQPPALCHNCGGKGTVQVSPDANQILRESNLDF